MKIVSYSCQILMKLELSRQIFEKEKKRPQIPSLIKIRPVVTELFHAHGQT